MRRPSRELRSELDQADLVTPLELSFANPMLLHVVIGTKADDPAIEWLERHATVGSIADMSALAGVVGAAGN